MLANLMEMMREEGEFFLDTISNHPGTIFAILIVAFFLFLLLKVAIFNVIFFSNPKKVEHHCPRPVIFLKKYTKNPISR